MPNDYRTQAQARIDGDERLSPHAQTLLHPSLTEGASAAKHYEFLATHHTDQLVILARTLGDLGLFDDVPDL